MRLLNYLRQVGPIRSIRFIDSKGLGRPPDLSAADIPAETPRVAHVLRFSQVSLAPPQGLFDSPTLAVLLLQVRIEVRLRLAQRFFGALLLGQVGYQREGQNDKRNAGNRQ